MHIIKIHPDSGFTIKKAIIHLAFLIFSTVAIAQPKIEQVIIITTDGFRWQELFAGMDSSIANDQRFNQGDSAEIFKNYWNDDVQERRKLLMPFFWNTFVAYGQVYGNRLYENNVNTVNPFHFSYPGYNELFTGYADTLVNSNDYPANLNVNVLEYLNQQPEFKNRVAVFAAWEAFNRILNEERSSIPVIAAFDTISGRNISTQQRLINKMLLNSYKPWGDAECLDVFTHYAGMEYLKTARPKVLYVSYGETDEWAHSGQYKDYLNAAHQFDKWLAEWWNFIQNDSLYKNKTALLITTDHGRGKKDEWTNHGKDVEGADEIWIAVAANGLPVKGEIKTKMQIYQQQVAATIANLIGKEFKTSHPVAKGLTDILK